MGEYFFEGFCFVFPRWVFWIGLVLRFFGGWVVVVGGGIYKWDFLVTRQRAKCIFLEDWIVLVLGFMGFGVSLVGLVSF